MIKTCRFVTLAVDAVRVPAGSGGAISATTHLAAIALLIAERDRDGAWNFAAHSRAIAAGDSEDILLAWAARTMPADAILLGWQLADAVVPPLLDAGLNGDPEIGHAFIARLSALLGAPSVDLALTHGGAGASTLDLVAAAQGISIPPMGADAVESAWAIGDRDRLRAHVEGQALAIWRLWLAEANGAAAPASDAFDCWLNA